MALIWNSPGTPECLQDTLARGAWPRVRRWRTPNFLAPEGPTKSQGEACHLRADRSPYGGAGLGAGPGHCRDPVAALESAGVQARLGRRGRRPAAHPLAETAASRRTEGRHGTRADGPRAAGDLGRVSPLQRKCQGDRRGPGAPGVTTPHGAAEQCCCWRWAQPLIVLGPACKHGTWPGRGT
ncbi:hypothetical protein NDU88_004530 [Pleurodeles waltl]|uniref:Uncharacterized protein n=1 Tax=Pleurodeles waltl TaxID=8319 RepID=A0AAV7SJ18_PLEWA|nr:hypothetical protein NDU88_004530 [Pleurodeles waltl]